MTYLGTIHTSPWFYNDYLKNGLDSDGGRLLMHEYGYYLHAQYAPLNFYSYAFWSSAATENSSSPMSNWTEIRANTMSYYYFGQPSYWVILFIFIKFRIKCKAGDYAKRLDNLNNKKKSIFLAPLN